VAVGDWSQIALACLVIILCATGLLFRLTWPRASNQFRVIGPSIASRPSIKYLSTGFSLHLIAVCLRGIFEVLKLANTLQSACMWAGAIAFVVFAIAQAKYDSTRNRKGLGGTVEQAE